MVSFCCEREMKLALHDQVSWGKYCASFSLSKILAERNGCDFCARNLLMYLHDVRLAIFQQYCRRIYRIDFVTIGLNNPVVRFHFISIYKSVFNVEIFEMLRARKRQAAAIVVITALNKQRKNRKCWVRLWIGRRNALGTYNTLLQELHIKLETLV